jgi:hypothetical protein
VSLRSVHLLVRSWLKFCFFVAVRSLLPPCACNPAAIFFSLFLAACERLHLELPPRPQLHISRFFLAKIFSYCLNLFFTGQISWLFLLQVRSFSLFSSFFQFSMLHFLVGFDLVFDFGSPALSLGFSTQKVFFSAPAVDLRLGLAFSAIGCVLR